MIVRFFRNLWSNFCLYLLVFLNLMHAIEKQSYDWLLWVSLILAVLSVMLNFILAVKGDKQNG